jgi:hypothetical protein
MAAKKMLDLAKSGGPVVTDPNSASFPDDDKEKMNQPAPPVLSANKPYHLTLLDPATTTVIKSGMNVFLVEFLLYRK